MPKVSVLTPIYNTNPQHLRECIESILNQTFTDFEFLILNDSPDNTEIEDVVKSYKDKRIKYHRNTKNIGISASRNKLLELARGEYLAIFDHDDISLPHRLEKEVAFLDAHPEIGVVGCNTQWFPKKEIQTYEIDNLEIKRALMYGCAIAHSGALIRKSVMTDNDIQWEEKYSPAEDYMLWIRLIDKTMFGNIPEILLRYRFLNTNTTNTQWAKMQDRTALIRSYAHRTYVDLLNNENYCIRRWIYLFSLIPVAKIKQYPDSFKIYLFGIIPLAVSRNSI